VITVDSRLPLRELLSAFDGLVGAGWQVREVASQPARAGGSFPIRAYCNADDVSAVLVGGIHGREPAGTMALARYVPRLIEHGRTRPMLVMPLLNPWGYVERERYGPTGQSVSDSEHALGRAAAPACPEAGAITAFVMSGIRIRSGSAVLDLHEDPVYESPGYQFEGFGSYLYFIGTEARDHAASRRVAACLQRSSLPLIASGVTRFGEAIVDGAIVDSEDGSIDELFARRLGCTPVITVENLLHEPEAPPLAERVQVYLDVLDAFFGDPRP
jgi:predicted deacylase